MSTTPEVQRHDPTFYNSRQIGAWATCTCGWKSAAYFGVTGAVLAHGQHLTKEAQ